MTERDVHLFIFDTLSDWEAAYAIAGINNPSFQQQPGRYRIHTAALSEAPILSAGGMRIIPDLVLSELSPSTSAMLILPGGACWDQGENMEATEVARAFLDADVPVAAICGATAGLARAGLLDQRRHTSNAREYLAASGYQGGNLYEDQPAVTDNHLITASGIAPVDFAREIFAMLALYSPTVLAAWYGLFKTGEARYFWQLMATQPTQPAAG